MSLSDFPPHWDAGVLVKKALEAALEASSQGGLAGYPACPDPSLKELVR